MRRKDSSTVTSIEGNNNQSSSNQSNSQIDRDVQVVEQTSDPGPSSSSGGSRNNISMPSEVPNEQPKVQGKQNFVLSDLTVPRFGNSAGQNPLRFIRDLETFFELRGVPRYARLQVVKLSLYAICTGWFEMHVSDDRELRGV